MGDLMSTIAGGGSVGDASPSGRCSENGRMGVCQDRDRRSQRRPYSPDAPKATRLVAGRTGTDGTGRDEPAGRVENPRIAGATVAVPEAAASCVAVPAFCWISAPVLVSTSGLAEPPTGAAASSGMGWIASAWLLVSPMWTIRATEGI